MITRLHTAYPAYPALTDMQHTTLPSAPPAYPPSAPPTFRSKRANPDVPPVVPEALSASQRQAAAYQRIFQDKVYGQSIVALLWPIDCGLLAEFETVLLKPLLQAGFLSADFSRETIGYACVQSWLSNYGADTSRHGPHLPNAVSAWIQIVNHIDTYYQPTPGGRSTLSPDIRTGEARDKAERLIRDLILAPDTLIQFAENLQRINNNPVCLNLEVLLLFKQHASNSTVLCRMLLELVRNHAAPYALMQAHSDALTFALARHPSPTQAQQLEIKAWIEEGDENRKIIRYLALMGSASEAGVEPLPVKLQGPMDAPVPYRQIWQLLEQTPRGETPLDADTMIEHLSNLVPEVHRAATHNAYRRMQALGLMRYPNHWILPLLRPDLAVELAHSQLLERLGVEDADFEFDSLFRDYVGIARSGHWLSVYRFLSPAVPIPLDPIPLAQPIEQLYAVGVRSGALPAVDSIEEKRSLLALEGVKQQLAALEGSPECGFLRGQPQIAVLEQEQVVKNLMRIQLGLRGEEGVRAQSNAIAHALRSQFPAVGAPPAAHIAALTSMRSLADALRILIKDFAQPIDTAMIDVLRLAGPPCAPARAGSEWGVGRTALPRIHNRAQSKRFSR